MNAASVNPKCPGPSSSEGLAAIRGKISLYFSVPNCETRANSPSTKPKSPTRLVMNALRPA